MAVPEISPLPRFYTIQEAADVLKFSYRTMWSWVASGEIKSVPVGLRRRITQDAIEEYCKLPKPQNAPAPIKRTEEDILRELRAVEKRWKI